MTDMVRINHNNNHHHDNHTSVYIKSGTELYPPSVLLTKISQSTNYFSHVVSQGVIHKTSHSFLVYTRART